MLAHWCQRGVALMLIVGAATAFVSSAFAFDVPPNDGYITDASGVTPPLIDSQKEAELEAALADYYAKTSNQIAVVIIRSLGYEQLEDVSLQIARKFGIGDKQHSNGILMLVSYDDRAVRFEVGYGLEGAVPDLVAKGIIETDIIPAFRQGDYAGGIVAAIQALQKHIGNEYTADRYAARTGDNDGMGAFPLFALFIAFQWLLSILARTKSWWLGGVFGFFGGLSLAFLFGWWLSIPILIVLGLFLDFVVSRNYRARGPTSWWAGGNWGPGGGGRWGGGGSGGGFGGFGGGGFGGGGASGRW